MADELPKVVRLQSKNQRFLAGAEIAIGNSIPDEHVECVRCGAQMRTNANGDLFTAGNVGWVCDACGAREVPYLMPLLRRLRLPVLSFGVLMLVFGRERAFLPTGAVEAIGLMTTQPRKIEGSGRAGVLEAVLDVEGSGVLAGSACPRQERPVLMLRDPGFPATMFGNPEADRRVRTVVGHA